MAVLRKPAKPDYTLPNAHRPIAHINTLAKVLSACVVEDIVHMTEIHKTLPENHFSCWPGRTTSDSLHFITKFVKDAWRKNEVVSALFLDIKSTFPSVMLERLVHDMRFRGVPSQDTNWIRCKTQGRKTALRFDSYGSELVELFQGLDQGCPLSGVAFQYYNADLLDVCNTSNSEEIIMFMDDALLLARAKTLSKANSKLHSMMERQQGGLEQSQVHQCEFVIDKFGVMDFSRRREPNLAKRPLTMLECRLPIFLRDIKIPAISVHKFLGVLIDQELHWKDQVNYTLQKGSMWVMQYHRLAKLSKGVSAKYMRRFYTSIAIP